MADPILFYGTRAEWGEFSNFWHSPFELDGRRWRTVEHYFQAMKSHDRKTQEFIRGVGTPGMAKRAGREVKLRKGWDGMKLDVMTRAVFAKFDQNPLLRATLLSTGDAPLHEDCNDPWWGGGPHYPRGRDWLGKVLMNVRFRLREKYGDEPSTDELLTDILDTLE